MNYDVQVFSFSMFFFLDLNYILYDMIYHLHYESSNSPQMSFTKRMHDCRPKALHKNQNRQALLAELQLVRILFLKSGNGQENIYTFYVKQKKNIFILIRRFTSMTKIKYVIIINSFVRKILKLV